MQNTYLSHHGVKGMKWGKHKDKEYRSTSIRSALARRANAKVDKSFEEWKVKAQNRDNAIELGKKANVARLAYEKNPSDKGLQAAYKKANADYQKALRSNTTYHKGDVRKAVGQDISKKYLSQAKKIKKQLDADPGNKALQKQYTDLMNKHDIERAKARRAPEVASKRSNAIASFKRSMTMTAKAAIGTAAVAAGAYAVNAYLTKKNVTINGKPAYIGAHNIRDIASIANNVKNIIGFIY